MSEQRLIDGTKATKEVMEYSRKLHEAGNVDAAGYVMWAASIVDEQPTIDPLRHGYVLSSVHEQVQWERDIAIDQLHSYGVEFGEKAEIQRVRHGKWINVKDRLPERTGDYLIIYSREICRPEMAVAFFSAEDAEDCPYDTNYGFEYTTYGDHKDVLYWMPLPEMPMEENDKE